MGTNVAQSSRESFQKIRKFSEKRTIQPEIPGENSKRKEIPGKKCPKIPVYLARLSSFSNVPNFCSIRHWKFSEINIERFHGVESAPYFPLSKISRESLNSRD